MRLRRGKPFGKTRGKPEENPRKIRRGKISKLENPGKPGKFIHENRKRAIQWLIIFGDFEFNLKNNLISVGLKIQIFGKNCLS
jgi:hypothetical protein